MASLPKPLQTDFCPVPDEAVPLLDQPRANLWDEGGLQQELLNLGDSPEAVGMRLQSMLKATVSVEDEPQPARWHFERSKPPVEKGAVVLKAERPSPQGHQWGITQQEEHSHDECKRVEMQKAITRARENERLQYVARHLVLALGTVLLAALAYLFHQSALAAIPLFGLLAMLILWFVFERPLGSGGLASLFRLHEINVSGPATESVGYYLLQQELAARRVQLELARIDRQIAEARGLHSSGESPLCGKGWAIS